MDSELLSELEKTDASVEVVGQKSPKKIRRKDKASLLSRGLDFKQVARVVLFEPAVSAEDYIHKVGRCGRDQDISNIIPTAISLLEPGEAEQSVWSREIVPQYGPTLPDDFALGSFVKYQYRIEDLARKASKQAIRKMLDAD